MLLPLNVLCRMRLWLAPRSTYTPAKRPLACTPISVSWDAPAGIRKPIRMPIGRLSQAGSKAGGSACTSMFDTVR